MKKTLLLIAACSVLGACSNKRTAAGTFPDFGALMLKAAPNLKVAALAVQSSPLQQNELLDFSPFAISVPQSSQFSTTAGDWTLALNSGANTLGTVLDGSSTAPITSMFALVRAAQGNMDKINSDYSDESGEPTNCTAIAAGTNVTIPFWSTATNASFNNWTDSDKYTCYATFTYNGATGYNIFGRKAIASPPAGCTDAFEYYVTTGYGGDDVPTNTQDGNRYGTTSDNFSIGRYYFNGCTKDMKINLVWHTLYSGGAGAENPDQYRFSGRSELTGNETEKTFTIRTSFIDDSATVDATDSGGITVVLGHGKSRKKDTADSTATFAIGYDKDMVCNLTGTCGSEAASGGFCISNAGTEDSYVQDTSAPATTCASHVTGYDGLTELVWNDIPSTNVILNNAAFGLP